MELTPTKEARYFIIDFDSTFTKVEAMEELADIALQGNPRREEIVAEIKRITDLGMNGDISFTESLERRIALLHANQSHLAPLVEHLRTKVSASIERNRAFFREYADQVYIISNGFREFIVPIVTAFGVKEENVIANTFEFDAAGNITGFDRSNPLSANKGKPTCIKSLNLHGDVYVIGDGYTDYEIKEAGYANKFYAFTENVERERVVDKADHVTPSLDEFLFINKLPASLSYPKNRISVLLLENIHPRAVELFREEGFKVEVVAGGLDEDELAERIRDVSVLGIRSKTQVTRRVLESANKLMCIGAFCIGTNQIDLTACQERGIAVFNAPYSNTRSVVELAIGEIIMLIRNIPDKSYGMHGGTWDKSAKNSFEIRGKKLGIVGYGNIGTQLSVLAEALGMEVYYYDRVEKLALGNAKRCRTLAELLQLADIVTLHVDGRPENKNLIGANEFALMKKGAIFLNLSRGHVVDIAALVAAIKSKKVVGAGIDVFPYEPKTNQEAFVNELRNLPNVILTPHIGGSTEEAQKNIAQYVPDKLNEFINKGNTFGSVNFPNLQLPELTEAHRFIHIHRNVPGVLAQINSILARHDINILGQYLNTNNRLGYVITDVEKEYNRDVIKDLKNIEHTIKFRMLY
jgi:D-3-phosphoglycerate dehydrogenase